MFQLQRTRKNIKKKVTMILRVNGQKLEKENQGEKPCTRVGEYSENRSNQRCEREEGGGARGESREKKIAARGYMPEEASHTKVNRRGHPV